MALVVLVDTLISGNAAPPLKDAGVLVRDGKFVQVGPRASLRFEPSQDQVIQAENAVLIPGLIDLHCHFFLMNGTGHVIPGYQESTLRYIARGMRNAEEWFAQGVTTVRELACKDNFDLQLRDLIESGGARGPRIFASGRPLTMTAGLRGAIAAMAIEVDGANSARKAARQQLRAGVDHLKLFATAGIGGGEGRLVGAPGWPQMTQEEMRAACEEAHKAGRKVAVHAIGTEGIKNAVLAGADTIEHGSFLDEEAIELMREHGTALVPTLAVRTSLAHNATARGYESHIGQRALQSLPIAIRNHQKAYKAGVKIGVGTDNVEGSTVADECRILHEQVGLSTAEVLRAATLGAAEIIGVADKLGSVEPGKLADFVVLEADPLKDIGALERVRFVVKGGQVYSGVINSARS